MNAIDPAATAIEPSPDLASARAASRVLGRIAGMLGLGILILGAVRLGAVPVHVWPVLAPLRGSVLLSPVLASLLAALGGVCGCWIMAAGRHRVASGRASVHRLFRLTIKRPADPALLGRRARWPQGIVVGGLSAMALAVAWIPAAAAPAVEGQAELLLGVGGVALAFPVLLAERIVAALAPAALPEAAPLHRLLRLPLLTLAAAGLLGMAAGAGLGGAIRLAPVLGAVPALAAAELLLRALGRCFLPPPPPAQARAVVDTVSMRIMAQGIASRAASDPLRRTLGLDFARSWALGYLRAATPMVLLFLVLLSWGLSGVVLVGVDQRAVYERLGAPVRVLHPGLHAILPWPLGKVRRVEFGTIHDASLLAAAPFAGPVTKAEDPPPPEADRVWEQAHPGELIFLIASHGDSGDSFQVVSADIKLRYRVGLADEDALRAAYGVADPEAVLRATAGRVLDRFLAARTLNSVLGENREAMAGELRSVMRGELDRTGCGLDLTAVVIEAIHPPAGAAAAYHNVQAAEVQATTMIAAERGKAVATQAKARLDATTMTTQAQAAAAETVGTARADVTRFAADHAAARAHATAFLLERRLSGLAAALAKSPATIIDHRLPATQAPLLDLRPLTSPAVRSAVPQE